MQDKLKDFVEAHREELELYQPREHLWNGIDAQLHHRRNSRRWQQLALAASILLLVTCGTWLFVSHQQPREESPQYSTQPPLREAEVYFTALLHMKDAEMQRYCQPQPKLCQVFEQDLQALSQDYQRLKAEFTAALDKQAILEAMLANLQTQVQLINRQLQIMKRVQKQQEVYRTT